MDKLAIKILKEDLENKVDKAQQALESLDKARRAIEDARMNVSILIMSAKNILSELNRPEEDTNE